MSDLPTGYRWATEAETEAHARGMLDAAIVVPRTTDSTGHPYTQDEADLAVPLSTSHLAKGPMPARVARALRADPPVTTDPPVVALILPDELSVDGKAEREPCAACGAQWREATEEDWAGLGITLRPGNMVRQHEDDCPIILAEGGD